jgi:hypothetical protein
MDERAARTTHHAALGLLSALAYCSPSAFSSLCVRNRSERLSEVYTKLHEIGADSAEARASAILSGLQVTKACSHLRRD